MTRTFRLIAASVLTAALLVPSLTLAQPNIADVVRLRDGTFVRGTLIERSATQVVILLPSGESRTYLIDAVEFAGPELPGSVPSVPVTALAGPPPVSGPPVARLHVQADQSALSLQRLQGTDTVTVFTGRSVGTAYIDQFSVLCNAPCDIEIPEGTYQLGIAQGEDRAVRAGAPTFLGGDMTLKLNYNDHTGTRVAGWLTLILGNLVGGAMMVLAPSAGSADCSFSTGICDSTLSMPLLIGGAVIATVASIASIFLIGTRDSASVEAARSVRAF